jgi:hypothetical protein
MTKAKTKDQPALFAEGEALPRDSAVTLREGDIKKNLNERPKTPRPSPPKSQTAPKGAAVAKVEPQSVPPNMLAVIANAAANPAVDIAKMEALYRLYQETEGKQKFHDALLAIELPSIDRDGKIPVQGGKALRFASFENVHKAVMPLLRLHGFRMSFQPMPSASGEGLVVECRLIRGTYEEKCVVPISTSPASRAMNSQQAIGAAIKYASRYGMMYLLNLRSEAQEDRDTDGNDPAKFKKGGQTAEGGDPDATISGQQAKELLKAISDCGIEGTRFMEKYKIAAVHELPAKLFQEAMKACRDYKARAEAAKKN